MNEKIKELAIKSWLVSEHKGKLLSCYREDVDLTKYLEDFAELIVAECAKLTLTFNYNLQSLNDKEIRSHANRVSDYVKDHMGCNNEQSV